MTGLWRTANAGFVYLALLGSIGCYAHGNNSQGIVPSLGISVTNASNDAIRVYLADEGTFRSLLGVVEAGQTRRLRLSWNEGQSTGTLRRLLVTRSAGDEGVQPMGGAEDAPPRSSELLSSATLTSVSWTVRDKSISGLPQRSWTLR